MIWPDQLWVAKVIFVFGSVLLFGSLGSWFFANYRFIWPVIARARNGNIVESHKETVTDNPIGSFGDFSDVKCGRVEGWEGKDERHFKIFLTFTFRRDINVDTIRMLATRYKYSGSRIKQKLDPPHEWSQCKNTLYYEKSPPVDIPIAYIPAHSSGPGVYGDQEGDFLTHGTAHDIEVELRAAGRTQRKTVQIFMAHLNKSGDPPCDLNSDRFLIFQDGKLTIP